MESATSALSGVTSSVRTVVSGVSTSTGIFIAVAVVLLVLVAYFQVSSFSKNMRAFSTVSKMFGVDALLPPSGSVVHPNANGAVGKTPEKTKHATLYMFYVTWCPHCTKAGPEWDSLVTSMEGRPINGTVVSFEKINCTDDDSDPQIAKLMSTYSIDSFPTIKLVKDDNQVIDFDAKITEDNLKTFLKTTL